MNILKIGVTPALVLLSVVMLIGCSGDDRSASSKAADPNEPELFTLPADQASHVQVLTIQPTTAQRTLRLTGAVAYNSFRTTPVITQVSGTVTRIAVAPGQNVHKGDAMLFVASPDYSQLRSTYVKARDANQLADKEYARAQDLYAHHAIAEKDLLAAESARVQAEADMNSAQAALRVMGIADPETLLKGTPSYEVPVRAPIGGQVVEQDVAAGQLIQPGSTQCFMISDIGTVWVLLNIYQKDLPYIRVGDEVSIQTDTYPQVFHGKISYVAAALDPSTRTLQARVETQNPGGKLKRDMFVTATVNAGKQQNAFEVPDSAVLRDNENQPFVYAEVSSGRFGKRPVTLGESQGGQTEIASGVKAGDRVIGDGSLFLQFANSLQR